MDGTYISAHPREWTDWNATIPKRPTKKLVSRRALAHYTNVAATILDQKASALFRGEVTRSVKGKTGDTPLEQWWKNVDGWGCSIDDWMSDGFIAAGIFGHVFHYMDRDADVGETAADAAQPYLRLYLPLDVPDWTQNDRGLLTGVSLLEAITNRSLKEQPVLQRMRVRLVTETTWEVYESGSLTPADTGEHGFGVVPVVVQYALRQRLEPLIGKSLLGHALNYIRLYNLDSEIAEILRAQTFGILNVPLGTGDNATDIEKAKLMLGGEKGVENVMFSPGEVKYVQPDAANVIVYQAERDSLLRRIYRQTQTPFEADSKDAEAAGSLKLKREDMNQVLSAYGQQCQKAEVAIAKLWFRATYGADQWEREWESAEVLIKYPDTFEATPFAEMLEEAQAAITLEMGDTFMKELRKRLITKFLPDATQETLDAIEKELEQTPVKSQAQQRLEEMAMRFGGQPGQPPGRPQPGRPGQAVA